jgi:hypothetical protein
MRSKQRQISIAEIIVSYCVCSTLFPDRARAAPTFSVEDVFPEPPYVETKASVFIANFHPAHDLATPDPDYSSLERPEPHNIGFRNIQKQTHSFCGSYREMIYTRNPAWRAQRRPLNRVSATGKTENGFIRNQGAIGDRLP